MSNHAFLSPSSSHRWLNCTPSAVLESKFENKSTKASEEGTVAHAWCEHKLKTALHRKAMNLSPLSQMMKCRNIPTHM